MKIRPIILCGGAGTRLWPQSKNNLPKQFIDFGGWTLFEKTLKRIKHPIFDFPIITTNIKYVKLVKKHLRKNKIKNYRIVAEPYKKNTAAAILASTLIKDVSYDQKIIFFPSDHIIENSIKLYKSILSNQKYLDSQNIFIFGIKPNIPSSEFGYFLSNINNNLIFVKKFIEKPSTNLAKKIIKKKGSWNSGIFFSRKDSIINSFINFEPKLFKYAYDSVRKSKLKNNVYYLSRPYFKKIKEISFDFAILEKHKKIMAIRINIPWSDMGNWKEICKYFKNLRSKKYIKKNTFYRPWGKYINLFNGKGFLLKEIIVNPKSSISLQKHLHRSEKWTVIDGRPKITVNNKKFFKKPNESVEIPMGALHRIENPFKKHVKIVEAQIGTILKESDIIRFSDIYGRI